MAYLAKMAELAINRQNRQTVNKNTNEMAKGPFGKVAILVKMAYLAKMAVCHILDIASPLAIFAKIANFAKTAIFAKIASFQGATFGIQFKSPEAGNFFAIFAIACISGDFRQNCQYRYNRHFRQKCQSPRVWDVYRYYRRPSVDFCQNRQLPRGHSWHPIQIARG